MAAALAGGRGASVGFRGAGHLWDIRRSAAIYIDVISPSGRPSRGRIRMHRIVLPSDEVTELDGIPVTTPGRTILDLAAVLTLEQLKQAIARAEHHKLDLPLHELLARHPQSRGAKTLRAALRSNPAGITKSELEDAFQTFLAGANLPEPDAINPDLHLAGHWIQPDALWHRKRLIVEVDSREWHDNDQAFESDRIRDRELQAAGWRVIRVTAKQLVTEHRSLRRDLARLLTPQ